MDTAGEELWRIVMFVKRRPWLMDDPNNGSDTLGTTGSGDTALHRLCAWHTNAAQLQEFIATHTPNLTQTNNRGVTCLHLAVYRNSYHATDIIQHLLALEPSLASTPMNCGSYPLHILCGQSITIRKDVLTALLQADPSVVNKQDRNGDTPLSLLWKNVQRFRWARQSSTVTLEKESIDEPTSKQMMISPEQCLDFSLQMIRATLHKQTVNLVDVCSMPRCPPLLIHLVLQYSQLLQLDLNAADHQGRTPLHHAAIQPIMNQRFTLPIEIPSVMDFLLQVVPHQASLKDNYGRIPLHYALQRQSLPLGSRKISNATLDRLVTSNPDCLLTKDPVTGFYPFVLVAMQDESYATTACTNPGENIESDDCRMENGQEDVQQLDTILRLLSLFPEAAVH